MSGHAAAVEVLLQQRANPDRAASCGVTPLHVAMMRGRVDIARMLSRFPAYFEAQTPEVAAPLAAFGLSARQDGSTARFTARLTTR